MAKVGPEMAEAGTTPAFEDILTRLENVVERLEAGDLALESSLALFEEGVRLSRIGAVRLTEAERRIERLLHDESGAVTTEPREKEIGIP
jgi:exodeoxyribonuclease VII small subunit